MKTVILSALILLLISTFLLMFENYSFRTIPKLIHQMWLDKSIDDNEGVPVDNKKYSLYTTYSNTIKNFNKDFEYVFWNNDKINNLFDDYPILQKYKSTWNNFPHLIEKCDFARYMILYVHGGVYIDLDYICRKNLYPLIKNREIAFVWEPQEHLSVIANSFLGSYVNNPLWLQFMDHIVYRFNNNSYPDLFSEVLKTTGPISLTDFFIANGYDKNIFWFVDTCLVIPITYNFIEPVISKQCLVNGKKTLEDIDPYLYTYWNEGTNWTETNYSSYYSSIVLK
jgi:mannosyltransferase OCH1-like enzyme